MLSLISVHQSHIHFQCSSIQSLWFSKKKKKKWERRAVGIVGGCFDGVCFEGDGVSVSVKFGQTGIFNPWLRSSSLARCWCRRCVFAHRKRSVWVIPPRRDIAAIVFLTWRNPTKSFQEASGILNAPQRPVVVFFCISYQPWDRLWSAPTCPRLTFLQSKIVWYVLRLRRIRWLPRPFWAEVWPVWNRCLLLHRAKPRGQPTPGLGLASRLRVPHTHTADLSPWFSNECVYSSALPITVGCACEEMDGHAPVSEQKPHGGGAGDTRDLPVKKQARGCKSCLLTQILSPSCRSRVRITSVSTPASVLQQAWGVFGDCRHLTSRHSRGPKWMHLPQKLI